PVSTWGAGRIPLRTPLCGLSLSAVPSKRRVRSSCSSTVSCCGCWRRQCLIRAWHLLQFLCEIPHGYLFPFRFCNLCPHPRRYDTAEHPHLLTFREQHHPHEQGKFPLYWDGIIHGLRIEQVRGNGNTGIPYCKAAVCPCHVHIPFYITSVGRAYIDQRPVYTPCCFFLFRNVGKGFIDRRVIVALAVIFVDAHRLHLLDRKSVV